MEDVHYGSIVICPPEGNTHSFVKYLTEKKMVPLDIASYNTGSLHNDLSLIEISLDSVRQLDF